MSGKVYDNTGTLLECPEPLGFPHSIANHQVVEREEAELVFGHTSVSLVRVYNPRTDGTRALALVTSVVRRTVNPTRAGVDVLLDAEPRAGLGLTTGFFDEADIGHMMLLVSRVRVCVVQLVEPRRGRYLHVRRECSEGLETMTASYRYTEDPLDWVNRPWSLGSSLDYGLLQSFQ